MYLFMACLEEPLRSFRAAIAAMAISKYLGLLEAGFLPVTRGFLALGFDGVVAGADAASLISAYPQKACNTQKQERSASAVYVASTQFKAVGKTFLHYTSKRASDAIGRGRPMGAFAVSQTSDC